MNRFGDSVFDKLGPSDEKMQLKNEFKKKIVGGFERSWHGESGVVSQCGASWWGERGLSSTLKTSQHSTRLLSGKTNFLGGFANC